MNRKETTLCVALLAAGLIAPVAFSAYTSQIAFLWVMVIFALTWDMLGGHAGYNSFGNVLFFGVGAYTCAVIQRDAGLSYFTALFLGLGAAGVMAAVTAVVFGLAILDLRGHYFAIATLGLGIAGGEIAAGWRYVGAGSGLVPPLYPGQLGDRGLFFSYLFLALAAAVFVLFRRLYRTQFGLALHAIRDNEDKAEAMGLHTTRYKVTGWSISAFFLGITGGGVGNLIGFIDPHDVAFAGSTYGVWMLLMAILGGKGTIWGPVLGAFVFHITQELFWTYLLGWQRVAMGVLIVLIVMFFPQGILGWARERWPQRFGATVEDRS
ncbi:MAG TPA: branched-chain amino acid ABC transporter permease [Gammaproteobacteria bacterium]|nr:branched-chain amino acid ABC transporter permease [Gammaproteobacteria bacterium]